MKKRLPVDLDEKVKRTFQMKCFKNKQNMSEIIRKFVEAYNKDSKAVTEFINK